MDDADDGAPTEDSDDVGEGEPTDSTDAEPTTDQEACFEAGIKFGSLYHQFAGTPVSPESAPSLERAIEAAIENQPHCTDVTVDVLEDRLAADVEHGYTELTGKYMDVALTVEYEGREVRASMAMEEGYPLMGLDSIRERGHGEE